MGKYQIVPSGKFRKDIKKYLNKPKARKALYEVIDLSAEKGYQGIILRMRPHRLPGDYRGCWECHVLPDLLLIWEQREEPENEIYLVRTGTHSDLF